ncbi:hypothetical protein [Lonepinella sp. MS14435]|uniref:hypothetical protein n=1 Tax=unclassified Lonepinella TaxID=2642006 RepID=UPI0036DBB7DA
MSKKPILTEHSFSSQILSILENEFGENATQIYKESHIIQYLNIKTRSANKGSKSRGSFANHYALYVLIEDYINKGYLENDTHYAKYEGAKFTDLLKRLRELPFGQKLQNHALNNRLNDEFRKYFPTLNIVPIVRDLQKQRYWLQEDLIKITLIDHQGKPVVYNLAKVIIQIIEQYVAEKTKAFDEFIQTCQRINELSTKEPTKAVAFIKAQLDPSADARIFEIVSYAVLKSKYSEQSIWIGYTREDILEEKLSLYKTGRTNANDGGIDFVMKPLGRFFQVTETIDVNKYFLDIEKVQRFPITFVVKSNNSPEQIKSLIQEQASIKYKIEAIVASYMDAIEEIINVPMLVKAFEEMVNMNKLSSIMEEIIIQSKLEFNYIDDFNE